MFLNFHTALSLCSSSTGWWPLAPPLVSFSEAPLKCSEVMRENSTTPGVARTGQIQDFALGDQDLCSVSAKIVGFNYFWNVLASLRYKKGKKKIVGI